MKKYLGVLAVLAAFGTATAFATDGQPLAQPKEVPKDKPALELNDEPHTYKKCMKICVEEIGERDKCERICDQTPRK